MINEIKKELINISDSVNKIIAYLDEYVSDDIDEIDKKIIKWTKSLNKK